MFLVRSVAFVVLALAVLTSARGQESREADQKQEAAIRKIQQLLDEPLIQKKDFAHEMPLAKFLDAVAKRLPKDKQMTLRIDRDALGDKYAEVAATPVILLNTPRGAGLRTVLDRVIAKAKTKIDYRVEPTGIVLTTPKRAVFAAEYDIREAIGSPELLAVSASTWRKATVSEKAGMVVRKMIAMLDFNPQSIRILNGTRLAVRATGSQHAGIAQFVFLFRRLSDLQVGTEARLYEVDEMFYKKLTNMKRIPVEEAEQMLWDKKPMEIDTLFKLLPKQKRVQSGDAQLGNIGSVVTLLSRHQAVTCLPSPDQVRKGDKARQTILEGVSLLGELHVSPDRRFIRIELVESATEIQAIQKVKVREYEMRTIIVEDGEPPPQKNRFGEVPALLQSKHTQTVDLADGGSIIVPVYHRPRSAKEKNRYLALVITARIRMEEEERRIRESELQEILPLIVADVLKNPALKATRDFYGSPGDKRFALVDNDAWTWSKSPPLAIAGHSLMPAKREGQRLLGIRIEKADEGKITVALFNAGGVTNGTAIGAVSLHYLARPGNGAWTVELADR